MHQDRARHDCGHYRKALGKLHDPVWPDKTLEELLRTAFRGRIIEREEQRGVRRGEDRMTVCAACSEPFTPRRSSAKFCSTACRMAAHEHAFLLRVQRHAEALPVR